MASIPAGIATYLAPVAHGRQPSPFDSRSSYARRMVMHAVASEDAFPRGGLPSDARRRDGTEDFLYAHSERKQCPVGARRTVEFDGNR